MITGVTDKPSIPSKNAFGIAFTDFTDFSLLFRINKRTNVY